MIDMAELRQAAESMPGGAPLLDRARSRARRATESLSDAVRADPTLLHPDRSRHLNRCVSILDQISVLARQADRALEHARLTAAGAGLREVALLGRINPLAPEELDALSGYLEGLAEQIRVEQVRTAA